MNWDAIGAIAELLEAIGVIARGTSSPTTSPGWPCSGTVPEAGIPVMVGAGAVGAVWAEVIRRARQESGPASHPVASPLRGSGCPRDRRSSHRSCRAAAAHRPEGRLVGG
jgi:hypothetical protein